MTAETRSLISVPDAKLFVAFELGKKDWKLAMTSGFGVKPVVKTVPSGDWAAVARALVAGRQRLGLGPTAGVISCYEAGRDGFWIHRALTARGASNRVVDSASIEVNRRARRTKTDRIDAVKLVTMLVRAVAGEPTVWREVRVPPAADEATRHQSRERQALVRERTRLINQIRSWLATCGTALPKHATGPWWTTVQDWAGAALPAAVQARIARATVRLQLLAEQIAELNALQRTTVRAAAAETPAARLRRVKGLAATSISVLLEEGLVWRAFANRRQVGGMLGFAPTVYASGDQQHQLGISRAGNTRLQSVMTQLAWRWVRWQPTSALTLAYLRRFGDSARARKIGIVALARKLLIALWRWAVSGIEPAGAIMTAA
jgi:transposase